MIFFYDYPHRIKQTGDAHSAKALQPASGTATRGTYNSDCLTFKHSLRLLWYVSLMPTQTSYESTSAYREVFYKDKYGQSISLKQV
jgi:hypothetical protein